MRNRSWTDEQLIAATAQHYSVRGVIKALGLIPAGGNYQQVQQRIKELRLDTSHFMGKGWNVGLKFNPRKPPKPLVEILQRNVIVQSHQLKKRLFAAGLKIPRCESCGWDQRSLDGRIPVELDHINGIRTDNRLENLRILCPNCHSLQPTHRGRNKKVRLRKDLLTN